MVEGLVRNGRYNSKSEVLREGVRLVQERETRLALDAAIARGIADADAGKIRPAEEVFVQLEAQYRARCVNSTRCANNGFAARSQQDAEMRSDPSLGVPIDEAFEQILKTKRRQS